LRNKRTQSWLLRQLRLKTNAIKDALDFLLKAELICEIKELEQDLRLYQTTQKGEDALNTYYKLITKYFGKEIEHLKSDQ
jgi:predicted transcriptional regulator